MATPLKRFRKFLNTHIRELGKPADAVEAGAEVSKAVLEFAIALGLLAATIRVVQLSLLTRVLASFCLPNC